MLKRLILAFAGLFAFVSVASAAGTISFSLSQQFDQYGKPLGGCKLYFIQAGTTATPQNAYQDSGLTNALPNPLECDAAGRLPQFYLADGQIKIRLTDKNGVVQVAADNLLVIGPSSGGGGGGGSVDPTTIFETGSVKQKYGTGSIAGWVRLNGRTIGSATSGATERANSDCQSLFEYLWGADASLAVSGGRGVSANADWTANKTITLPDAAGRVIAGLDDMGAGTKGRLTATYFGTAANVLGAIGGNESFAMALDNLIQHDHSVYLKDPGHSHTVPVFTPGYVQGGSGANGYMAPGGSTSTTTSTTGITIWSNSDGNQNQNKTASAGSATPAPMRTVQPTILMTVYIKL
ncbi:MAG: hypothetical protein J0G95_10790 [Rhizobiales bacterium]|nr:hypothetical protein [Hyphomicrobiales bacterium]